MARENKFLSFEFKVEDSEDEAKGVITGYGAFFGNKDSYGDVIQRGAFKNSLREWEGKGKYPPMLLQHGGMASLFGGNAEDLLPIGKWTEMEENSRGLKVKGQLFALNTDKGQYIYEGLKSQVLDGLSIGFRTKKFVSGTKPTEPRRTLTEIDLFELSVVTFPANDKARVGGVKSAPQTIREFEDFLRDVGGFSLASAKLIASRGYKAFDKSLRDEDTVKSGEIFAPLAELAKRMRS